MPARPETMSRLVLGTAQLGMPYGIANKSGKPDLAAARTIVQMAWEKGIAEFDTAQAYGDSEKILGRMFAELGIVQEVKVVTKLHSIQSFGGERRLHQSVEESLRSLRVPKLECLLLHREEMLDMLDNGLTESLLTLVQKGYVRYLGVSVYSPGRARQVLGCNLFHSVQIPASVLDRRFQRAGIFEVAEESQRQVYIRSAFLQGLALMSGEDVPATMASVRPLLEKLDSLALTYHMSRQAIALLYLRDRFPRAKVIFGAEVPEQVLQNADCWQLDAPDGFLEGLENAFPEIDEEILNPAKWPH